jgi:hypothetical protein
MRPSSGAISTVAVGAHPATTQQSAVRTAVTQRRAAPRLRWRRRGDLNEKPKDTSVPPVSGTRISKRRDLRRADFSPLGTSYSQASSVPVVPLAIKMINA